MEGTEFSETKDQENWIQPNDPKPTKSKVVLRSCLKGRVSIFRGLIAVY